MDEHIERRTFVGETGTDDFVGFKVGVSYELHYQVLKNGMVEIQFIHLPCTGFVLVTREKFNKCFVK
jgi:hypothetical protein